MVPLIVIGVVVLAIIVGSIISSSFRDWMAETLTAIGLLIGSTVGSFVKKTLKIVGIYATAVFVLSLLALVFLILGIVIKSPGFTAFAFVFAILLFMIAWLPTGLILKATRVNKEISPKSLRVFISWLASIGFFAVAFPSLMTLNGIMMIALLSFVFFGASVKFNFLDQLVIPIIVIMSIVMLLKALFPEDVKIAKEYLMTQVDRSRGEMKTGTIKEYSKNMNTYAVVVSDIDRLYLFNEGQIDEIKKDIRCETVVRVNNLKERAITYDSQVFYEIQLARDNGSFVNGSKYYVEAYMIRLVPFKKLKIREGKLVIGDDINYFYGWFDYHSSSNNLDTKTNSSVSSKAITYEAPPPKTVKASSSAVKIEKKVEPPVLKVLEEVVLAKEVVLEEKPAVLQKEEKPDSLIITKIPQAINSMSNDLILAKGEHSITVNGEFGRYIQISSYSRASKLYVKSLQGSFDLLYDNGIVKHHRVNEAKFHPYTNGTRFTINSQGLAVVKMAVY